MTLTPFIPENTINVDGKTLLGNIRTNCARDLPWFKGGEKNNTRMVIVGDAPSLRDNIEEVRARQKRGQAIFALNSSWRYLRGRGIVPDAVVTMDARPETMENVALALREPTYFVASQVYPGVLDALAGYDVCLWHADCTSIFPEQIAIYDDYQHKPVHLIGGGATVAISSMVLGFNMGFREIHLYGVDSSYSGDRHHASNTTYSPGTAREVIFNGKPYQCSQWMARQAFEFDRFRTLLKRVGCRVVAHGTGLIPDISRHLEKQEKARHAA